jgi:hypothetical protein
MRNENDVPLGLCGCPQYAKEEKPSAGARAPVVVDLDAEKDNGQ